MRIRIRKEIEDENDGKLERGAAAAVVSVPGVAKDFSREGAINRSKINSKKSKSIELMGDELIIRDECAPIHEQEEELDVAFAWQPDGAQEAIEDVFLDLSELILD